LPHDGDQRDERVKMPRYVVQRTFPEGLQIPVASGGPEICRAVVEQNAEEGVTWVTSFVSDDRQRTFCIYDGPTPEAIRKTAARNELPVDEITQVSVLDPYFYI
jgi:hypothetical protein